VKVAKTFDRDGEGRTNDSFTNRAVLLNTAQRYSLSFGDSQFAESLDDCRYDGK